MKFEVKVRAGLNIARTSSSVDLTAGLRRDELGWLPRMGRRRRPISSSPRLTFDADGRSAGEAAAGAVGGALKASRMRLNCSSVSRLLNASLDAASLHVQARKFLNIVTSHAFVIH